MDIATTLLEYGAEADAESKAGFTPLHLSAQEGHSDMSSLLLEHKADPNRAAKVTNFSIVIMKTLLENIYIYKKSVQIMTSRIRKALKKKQTFKNIIFLKR